MDLSKAPLSKVDRYLKKKKRKNKARKEVELIIYEPMQCTALKANGEPCTCKCVGSDLVCKFHGGNPVIKSNLLLPAKGSVIGKYKTDFHPKQYIKLSMKGKSDVEIAAEFKVGVSTIKKWYETYQDFNEAFEIGQALYEAWWLKKGRMNLGNSRFNTPLYKYITGNKLGYSDKVESKNTNLSLFGVLQVPGTMSVEEWENQP